GIVNDMAGLKDLCAEFEVKLCCDCISSVGTVPVDLTGVYLASCASGKGLRSYPGVSIVFYHHDLSSQVQGQMENQCTGSAPSPPLPRYLDLSYNEAQQGIPFTFSSNLLHALHAALKRVSWEKHFQELRELSAWVRPKLRELGFELIGPDAVCSPAVITVALPPDLDSVKISNLIQEAGYLLSFNSEYLRSRNWIQICFMGECAKEKVVSLLSTLNRVRGRMGKRTHTT
ncbi:MAG TPA: aminotransferase V, partial [Clostridia bacterium]|nr:aminotransferase V [Clostridia bacterium]